MATNAWLPTSANYASLNQREEDTCTETAKQWRSTSPHTLVTKTSSPFTIIQYSESRNLKFRRIVNTSGQQRAPVSSANNQPSYDRIQVIGLHSPTTGGSSVRIHVHKRWNTGHAIISLLRDPLRTRRLLADVWPIYVIPLLFLHALKSWTVFVNHLCIKFNLFPFL